MEAQTAGGAHNGQRNTVPLQGGETKDIDRQGGLPVATCPGHSYNERTDGQDPAQRHGKCPDSEATNAVPMSAGEATWENHN